MSKADTNLNEKDSLQDLLNTSKQIMDLYCLAIEESANKSLKKLLMSNFENLSNDQRNIFLKMQESGYYEVKPCDKATSDMALDKFKKVQKQL